MTKVEIFDPPNRLAHTLVDSGGPTFDEAVRRADAKVSELGGRLRRGLDLDVSMLLEMHALDDDALMAEASELGRLALRIAEVAAVVGAGDTGEAARGVYAMVDAFQSEGLWRSDALDLHLSAIALFEGAEPMPAPAAAMLLRRLGDMRAAIGVRD